MESVDKRFALLEKPLIIHQAARDMGFDSGIRTVPDILSRNRRGF
jgi:hypothetical protein